MEIYNSLETKASKEFQELLSELDNLVTKKVNGNLLFGGKSGNFTDGLTDTNEIGAAPLRESQDAQSTRGKISIYLSPGGAADQIWVFQGKLPSELDEYFDASTYLNNGIIFDPKDVARLNELNNKLNSHFMNSGNIYRSLSNIGFSFIEKNQSLKNKITKYAMGI